MKNKSNSRVLQYIISGYCVLYFLMFAIPILATGFDATNFQGGVLELVTILLAFIIFLIGTIYSWINEKIGGIIICSWHFIVWAFSLLLWQDAGMVLILIFPMLFPAVFLIKKAYMKSNVKYESFSQQWKLTLRILLINYTAIYALIVFANIVPAFGLTLPNSVDDLVGWSYSSPLGLALICSIVLYIAGFWLSWKHELWAGFAFILWFMLISFLSIRYNEFANSGPWIFAGTVILLQGVFYIANNYNRKNLKNIQRSD